MSKANEKYISIEEYFAREDTAELRSEYYCGDVFAMAGGTPNHSRITVNLASLLNSQFRGGPCEAFSNDLRVQVARDIHYTYPDVVVVCGEMILAEGRSDTITNPVVIMEVLSESTKDYDRGTKFTAYRSIEALTDYILIDQDTVHIEYFSKESDGTWRLREFFNTEEVIEIKSIEARLPAKAIYERVKKKKKSRAFSTHVGMNRLDT
ncbi:MAG: Uma2 family endonuclease [Deltaproteobacteria bacterium]|nr:Uma2 family endonuclease [Deltaproteobacteria bacterium]